MEVRFKFRNDTKNKYRYQEESESEQDVIGSLYIDKSAFEGAAPQELLVTIDVPAKKAQAKK